MCIRTSAAALKAVNELDELMETAFGKRERKVVGSIIAEVNELESQSDKSNTKFAPNYSPWKRTTLLLM
jgi:uncharacterized protein Yka (UPF0111/DUF47 family)